MFRSSARRVGRLLFVVAPALALTGCSCCPPRPCCEPACAPAPTPPAPVAAAPAKVLIEIAFFSLPAGTKKPSAATTDVGHHPAYGLLSKEQADALGVFLSKEPGVDLLQLPSIVTVEGQEASIFVGEAIGPDVPGRTGVEPLTFSGGDNWTGTRAALIATPSADGRTIAIDFTFANRDAVGPGKAADLAASRASERAIRNLKLTVATGQTAVLGTGRPSDPATSGFVVLLTPTWLRSAEIGAPPAGGAPVVAARPVPAPMPIADRVEALTARLTLSIQNRPLLEVLKSIAMTTNLNVAVSPDVKNVPITLDVRDQDVASILTGLGTDRFAWKLEDYGVVRITALPPK